jgi:Tol biopolymer transport system component
MMRDRRYGPGRGGHHVGLCDPEPISLVISAPPPPCWHPAVGPEANRHDPARDPPVPDDPHSTGHTTRLSAALAGRYRIEKKLGEGGMASVYLAEDLKHQRKVAVKVLRPELAAVVGAERFLSEITTTANLQHPHILALFDSGQADGFLYYVMPYIEGETLRDRLEREKQLGVDEAVGIARDVADALDYAHRHGVIHRDIKPANILIHDGRPVVADFGIALAVSAAGGGRMTETGLSLGTPHYMSPEQASADRDLSARSDVYSLGCVLYEMIAGQPPHTGPSAQSILVRILTETPRSLTELRHTVPPHVAAVVMKSIEKLPADRFQTAKAFRDALGDPAFTYAPTAATRVGGMGVPIAPAQPTRRPGVLVWLAAVAGLGLLGGGYALARLTQPAPAPRPSAVFDIVGDSLYNLSSPCCGRSVAVSPQGDRVVFQGRPTKEGSGQVVRLYQRLLDLREPQAIPGTEDARHPFFSPDGQWVGFFAGNALKKVRVDGGTPLTVASGLGINAGAAWAPDNSIVFATRDSKVLFRVTDGGTPAPLTVLDTVAGEVEHYWPHVMPDGRTVLFGVWTKGPDGSRVEKVAETSLEGGGHRIITAGASPRYVEPGFLVFSDAAGSLMAQPFDAKSLEVSGERFRIAERATWRGDGSSEFDISRNGTLAYLEAPSFRVGGRQLVSVDTSGTARVLANLERAGEPRYSPDGRRIAYQVGTGDGGSDIWVWDVSRGVPTRVTFEGRDFHPVWAPGGHELLFGTPAAIEARAADGSGETRVVEDGSAWATAADFIPRPQVSPDGRWLLWPALGSTQGIDVWFRPLAGGEAKPLLNSTFDELYPSVSPDGKWIAYLSNASGDYEIYVDAFPELGHRFKVTTGGARDPVWSPDGKRLYFVASPGSADEGLSVVDVHTAHGFDVGAPRKLFSTSAYLLGSGSAGYDIAPDGTHFVFVGGSGRGARLAQVVVTNALNPGQH